MSFTEQIADAMQQVYAAMGQTVTYTAAGSSAVTIDAVCRITAGAVEDTEAHDVVSRKVDLTIKREDIATVTEREDTFTFDGDTYRVMRIIDGTGPTWRLEGEKTETQRVNRGNLYR